MSAKVLPAHSSRPVVEERAWQSALEESLSAWVQRAREFCRNQ